MTDIKWEHEAEEALTRVPFFVRKMVRKKVSQRVAENGGAVVTLEHFKEAEKKVHAILGDKSEQELKGMLPTDNEPGVKMVITTACQNEMSGCPNVLINTSEWKDAIDKWVEDGEVNERLRKLVGDDKVLFHHKMKVSVAGCPNGCSRPQIGDIGIVGYVRPDVDAETCTSCGACEDVCPDGAISVDGAPPVFDRVKCQGCMQCRNICPNNSISLSKPMVRILVGGKLGRHPHLAEAFETAKTTDELIEKISKIVNGYIENSRSGERFANYWLRSGQAPRT